MYEKIVVIGIGTLGGFVARSIADLEDIKEITILDYDIVEERNIKNSVYKRKHIGKPKVEALKELIEDANSELVVNAINCKYVEGETKLPLSDLVIDCRDFIYDRSGEIDIRLYMSSRYLIIDCKKDMKYENHYEGSYISKLSKNDIRYAATQVVLSIENETIKELIEREAIHKIDLDYLEKRTKEYIDNLNEKPDMVLECIPGSEKIRNLDEMIFPIMDENQKRDITISLGNDRKNPQVLTTLPKSTLKEPADVVSALTSMIRTPFTMNNFLVAPIKEKNKLIIVLLPETGAA